MSIESSLRKKIEEHFSPAYFELENESHGHNVPKNSETHFRAVIVSEKFEGVSRVDRQRQVLNLFDEEREAGLHAFTLRTMTPKEWEPVKDTFKMPSPACRGGGKN